MRELRRIFEPIKIGDVELRNRLVVLAIGTGFTRGVLNERQKDFIVERAKGGAGLVITSVNPSYGGGHLAGGELIPSLSEDRFIPEMKDMTRRVHDHGAKIMAQLLITDDWARGKDSKPELVGPSPVPKRPGGPAPRALNVEEIHQIIEEFSDSARRAREAGFDGVEFHAGIGFLLNQFISPATNKRTDEYGGPLENRMRLLMEVIERTKKKAGEDFPIICRISADEFMPGGHTLEDTLKVAVMLEEAGVKCLDVQAGWHESPKPLVQMSVPRGAFVYLSEAVKKVVKIPVVAAYRINDPILAEEILSEGKADLIGMARAFIADPFFALKAKEGRLDEIRPCIACCRCLDLIFGGKPLSCTVNAQAGREAEYRIVPASKPRNVLVIGGGPGGMEAARVASERGHRVTLWEKSNRLGGMLRIATIPPYKDEIGLFTQYLETQLKKRGVKIELAKEASPETVLQAGMDVVIVANGSSPIIPDIPGIEGSQVVTFLDVLTESKPLGEKVVIVGGGMVGCETAEFLAKKGKDVTILEMLPRLGNDIGPTNRWIVLNRLKEAGVKIELRAKVIEITEKGVKVERDGASQIFYADSVVIAAGMKPEKGLSEQLKDKVPQLYSIGDCVEARRIANAVEEGFRVAKEI
jgi:2,4-dienoyl-CoA reductase (NADPH2)